MVFFLLAWRVVMIPALAGLWEPIRWFTSFFDNRPDFANWRGGKVNLFRRSGVLVESAGTNPLRCGVVAAATRPQNGGESIHRERHPARTASSRCDRVDFILQGVQGDTRAISCGTDFSADTPIAVGLVIIGNRISGFRGLFLRARSAGFVACLRGGGWIFPARLGFF